MCAAKLRGRDFATGLTQLIAAHQLAEIWAADGAYNAHPDTKTHSIFTYCTEFKPIKLQYVLSEHPWQGSC